MYESKQYPDGGAIGHLRTSEGDSGLGMQNGHTEAWSGLATGH